MMPIGWMAAVASFSVLGQVVPGPAPARNELTVAASRPAGLATENDLARSPLAARRIVKTFDFDEQAASNFTNIPIGWRRHDASGFPLFIEGQFDPQVGHDKPPSYRLSLNGGSLAYHYEGRDIAVRPSCDYLVTAWVKTSGLKTTRAYISAQFLDRKNVPVSGTDVRSELLGGVGESTDWQQLTLRLRCDLPEARYLGLAMWLTQKRQWDPTPPPPRSIDREDIQASAWFDDVAIYRMPRVSLTMSRQGSEYGDHEPVEVLPEVSDPDGLNLVARLKINSADGRFQDERTVPVRMSDQKPTERFLYPNLPVGLYRTELIVSTQDEVLVRRALTFARTADHVSPPVAIGRGFGVILKSIDPAVVRGQSELLEDLRLEMVKVPVWYAQRAMAGQLAIGAAVDAYLEAIRATHADPVGIMMDDRFYEAASARSQMMSMLDMFNEAPLGWKHLIANVWTRYAGLIPVWQLGNDGDSWVGLDERLPGLVPRVRKEMTELMANPMLATPSSPLYSQSSVPVDYQSLSLTPAVPAEDVERHLAPLLAARKDRDRLWVTVEPLPDGPYPREERLAEFGRRLIETAFQKPGAVFINAPWDVRVRSYGAHVDPREELIIFRTVSDVLGDAAPLSRTTLDGQIQCVVFERQGQAILCVWDGNAPPEGREHELVLGERARVVDLWGQVRNVPTVGHRQLLRVGPKPVFVVDTLAWLIEFRRQFIVAPATLEPNFDKTEFEVSFRNTYPEPISGQVRLVLPTDWEVSPDRLSFSLGAEAVFREKVKVRFPLNAPARVMPLMGEFTIDANTRYAFTTPAWFDFGLEGIDLNAVGYRSGDRVTVRVSMTNRTPKELFFEGYLVVPNRPRLQQLFHNLQPGQSLIRNFVVRDAAELAGKSLRVSLKETQGSRMWNRIVTVP